MSGRRRYRPQRGDHTHTIDRRTDPDERHQLVEYELAALRDGIALLFVAVHRVHHLVKVFVVLFFLLFFFSTNLFKEFFRVASELGWRLYLNVLSFKYRMNKLDKWVLLAEKSKFH